MLKSILSPLTTATSAGVAFRYLSTIAASVIAILGILGLLSKDQVDALTKTVPELVTAIAALIPIVITVYATLTKSSSDKAAAAAKAIDKTVPADQTVLIKTPVGIPDIVVHGK